MTDKRKRELALQALATAAVAAQDCGIPSSDFCAAAIEVYWLQLKDDANRE